MLCPPPPPQRSLSASASFQTISGMYERADAPFVLVALQKGPAPAASSNSRPPTAVTSGMLAGKRTASPLTAGKLEPLESQEADAASLPEMIHVMPCAFPCWASPW